MAKYVIHAVTERCAGCLRCELACSEAYAKNFNPSAAWIRVTVTDEDCSIGFTEDCNLCGLCADRCLYGALSKTRAEAEGR
jgi:Fe-S-cluster-containing hydrogenase component 2